MNWKESIIKIVNEVVDELSNELDGITDSVDTKTKEYQALISDYTELQKEVSITRSSLVKDTAELNNAKASFHKEVEDFDVMKNQFLTEASKIQDTLITKRDQIDSLDKELDIRKKDIKSVEILEKQKISLVNEVAKLSSKLTDLSKELGDVEGAITKSNEDLKLSLNEFASKNANIIKDLDGRKEQIMAKEIALSAREKAIEQKESDLVTVEKRWRKLYDEKGAGFKI